MNIDFCSFRQELLNDAEKFLEEDRLELHIMFKNIDGIIEEIESGRAILEIEKNSIVAFALTNDFGLECHIGLFWVARDRRRTGASCEFLSRCKNELSDKGFSVITLSPTPSSRSFWGRQGFTENENLDLELKLVRNVQQYSI